MCTVGTVGHLQKFHTFAFGVAPLMVITGVSVSCCISSVVCGLECKLCLFRRCHKKLSDSFQFGGLWWLGGEQHT
jgi:hypothetical protein